MNYCSPSTMTFALVNRIVSIEIGDFGPSSRIWYLRASEWSTSMYYIFRMITNSIPEYS